jgi:sulfite exporter TauE/SafE
MTPWSALLLGLAGSLHCAGMCGPLALALPAGAGSIPGFAAGRVAYNLGRIVTYCLLGFVFGLVGRTLFLAGVQRWVSVGLGLGLLAGLASSRRVALSRPVVLLVGQLKSRMSVRLRQQSLVSLGILGLFNGFLPCGFVYVACAGATATGGLLAGTQYMAAFGLGTIPMMLGISLSGRVVPLWLRLQLRKVVPISVLLVATLLILRGLSLGIPYLSPDLSAGDPSCCHK